jgi:hypothetical protein
MDSVDVTTFPETEGAPMRRLTGGRDPDGPEAAVSPAQAVPAGDEHCAECGAPMASDQRYCVECGERRGERRFPTGPQPVAATSVATPPPTEGRRSRMSSSTTLIAGVGTLLLAMGVGVLIGRSGNGPSGHGGSGVQVVTVSPTAGASSGTTATTSTTAGEAAAKSSAAKAAASKSTIKAPKKSSLPPPTVKVGSKGTGKGYKNGHFTGEFFGSEE